MERVALLSTQRFVLMLEVNNIMTEIMCYDSLLAR